jgi:hypothetical protein
MRALLIVVGTSASIWYARRDWADALKHALRLRRCTHFIGEYQEDSKVFKHCTLGHPLDVEDPQSYINVCIMYGSLLIKEALTLGVVAEVDPQTFFTPNCYERTSIGSL